MTFKIGGPFLDRGRPGEPQKTVREALVEKIAFAGIASGATILALGLARELAGFDAHWRTDSETMVWLGAALLLIGLAFSVFWIRDARRRKVTAP